MPVIRDQPRPLGVVYTPAEVAAPMVRLALGPLVEGKSADELRALRVCDPAIGEGAFLVEVIEVIARALARAARLSIGEARREIAARCVAGVDVDRRALTAARRVTGSDAGALRVGDALSLSWETEFPEVFARGGFDVVVANPPYVRQESLGDKRVLRGFEAYDGVADLYVYFIELAQRLLRPGGRWCVIVPNKWMTAAYGARLRGFLAARTCVDGIADVSRAPLFAGADAFPCIVWGTKTPGRTTPVRAVTASATTTVEDALATAVDPRAETLERARWSAGPWHLDAGAEGKLLARIERAFPRLDETVRAKPARGLVTGCNRAFVIDAETRARIMDADPEAAALIRPFVKGRDIRRWQHADAARFVLLLDRGTAPTPAIRTHLARFRAELEPRAATAPRTTVGRKPGAYRWYELQDPVGALVKARAPRLLYQDIQTQPACALDAAGEVVPDTTVWMLPTDDPWVLAVLNSSLYGWYARRRFPPALNGAVRPKLAYLTALPLPRLAAADRRTIARLVARRDERALDAAIADAYELSRADRALIAR